MTIVFRIARFLRQSFRQSVRRFRGETTRQASTSSIVGNEADVDADIRHDDELGFDNFGFQMSRLDRFKIDEDENPPPPDYATVIIETNLPRSETSYGR